MKRDSALTCKVDVPKATRFLSLCTVRILLTAPKTLCVRCPTGDAFHTRNGSGEPWAKHRMGSVAASQLRASNMTRYLAPPAIHAWLLGSAARGVVRLRLMKDGSRSSGFNGDCLSNASGAPVGPMYPTACKVPHGECWHTNRHYDQSCAGHSK